jgi:hypothetical protein
MGNRNLYTQVGQSTVDNLIADNLVNQKRIEVILPSGAEFKRGQLLVLADDGKTASLPVEDTTSVDCVLLTEVGDTDGPTPAAASLTGEFNENCILWGGIPESNRDAVKKAAAGKQLFIAPAVKAPYIQFGEVG